MTPARDPNTFYAAYGADIKSLDPAEINDTESDAIASAIFECLYNYKYGVEPYELLPEIAADLPQVSADGLTVTVHLKRGIRFYDPEKKVFPEGAGSEVKAADLIYSWKRVANFHLASSQYSGIFEGRIEGLDDWFKYTEHTPAEQINWDRPVAGLQAPDDYTFVIKLTEPDPQLRYNMAHTPTAVVSRKAVEYWGAKFKEHPVGTGAYVLRQHFKEQRIVLTANPIYRGGPDVEVGAAISEAERLPHIQRVQYDYFLENLPVWLLFRQGMFDVGGIPKDSFKQAIAGGELTPQMFKDGVVLTKLPAPEIFYYGCNMDDPVVGKNKPLRQAMSMAYDRKAFIEIYENGRGLPAIGPIPPGFATFDAKRVNPYTYFNLEAARGKLKEAETIQGGPIPELTLLMPGTDTAIRQDAEFFASNMQQIGLKIKIEYRNWARFQAMVDAKQAQIYALGWVADYPDEQTFLQLFYGKNVGNNGINSANYKNPAFDALYEKASVMNPSPERNQLYQQMSDIVMEDCPWLMMSYPVAFTLHYDWLGNVKVSEYSRNNRMYQTLDSAQRTAWLKHHR
jgi:ABC-type transport system substrate-binding protein